MEEQGGSRRIASWADTAGKFLALVAVLTPVAGAAIRLVAFMFDSQMANPLGLALTSTIPELIYVAAQIILPALLIIALVLLFAWFYSPPQRRTTMQVPRRSALLAVVVAAVSGVVASPNFPAGAIVTLGSLASGWMLGGRMGKRPSSASILPPAGVFLACSVLAGALTLRLPASVITLAPSSPVGSGTYIWMGAADGFDYLRSCGAGPVRIVGVAADLVIAREVVSASLPGASGNVVDIVAGRTHPVWGIRYDC